MNRTARNGSPGLSEELAAAYAKARRHLVRRTPAFKEVIAGVGACTLRPDPDRFRAMVRFIVFQQISTKAAASIFGRLEQLLGNLTPAALTAVGDAELRACGLSSSKLLSLRGLAVRLLEEPELLDAEDDGDDAGWSKRLLPLRGVGPWTVHMFQIFSLGRLDVLPVGDLGLRLGAQALFGLTAPPGPAELEELAKPWRPYRTVATWYLWKGRGFVPQS